MLFCHNECINYIIKGYNNEKMADINDICNTGINIDKNAILPCFNFCTRAKFINHKT